MATVYGKFCMEVCSADVVLCEDGEACLQTSMRAGDDPDAGVDVDAGAEEALWVCLPGELQNPDYVARELGTICDYSVDCVVGGVCVCIPGATCEGEGKNGPTCQRLCDPAVLNQCPIVNVGEQQFQLQCTDLGTGRGFCDPTTVSVN
jgi:hypothetical protein